MLPRIQQAIIRMGALDCLVIQRQTSPLPHIVDVQGLAAILLLLEGLIAPLVGGIFLEILEQVLI